MRGPIWLEAFGHNRRLMDEVRIRMESPSQVVARLNYLDDGSQRCRTLLVTSADKKYAR